MRFGQIIQTSALVSSASDRGSSSIIQSVLTKLSTIEPVQRDVGVSLLVVSASFLWLQLWIELTRMKLVDTKLARKIVHVGSAPMFMLLWPLYSSSGISSRLIASAVPLLMLIRLISSGNKTSKSTPRSSFDELVTPAASQDLSGGCPSDSSACRPADFGLSDAISRSGDRREALVGPLLYTLVLLFITLTSFRDSPIGVIALCQLAVGDGVADIVGRRWGEVKWFCSRKKSLVGSAAFAVGAFVSSYALLTWLHLTSSLTLNIRSNLPSLALITALTTLSELIPCIDDNLTVPAVAALTSWSLLRPSSPSSPK